VPLLEGMALYAEWRAVPSPGGIFSRPFDIFAQFARAGWARHGPDIVPDVEDEKLLEFLRTEDPVERQRIVREWMASERGRRLDREAVFNVITGLRFLRTEPEERRRLAKVLSLPVGPERGGYQLGYLFVCALEVIFAAHVGSDAMLAYVRDYFFQDYELAALILDEEIGYEELYSTLRKTLQSKVERLIASPDESRQALREWAESRPDAPVVVTDVDAFFGRDRSPDEEAGDLSEPGQAAFQRYTSRFDAFCLSMGADEIHALILRDFLLAGRVLMPLGSRDFAAAALDDDWMSLRADDGLELRIPIGRFSDRPAVGDTVIVAMLVNVASPGAAVSVRWGEHFEVLPLIDDPVSKGIIEKVYNAAEVIRGIISTGQDVIEHLHRTTIDGFEPIEKVPIRSTAAAARVASPSRPSRISFNSKIRDLSDLSRGSVRPSSIAW